MLRKSLLLLSFLVFASASGNGQVSFRIPLYLSCGTIKDTLYLGVGPNNTIGIDDAPTLGLFKEAMAPPLPPPPFLFDARFTTLPNRVSTYPTGLGTGSYDDFRPYVSAAQIDSFRIILSGNEPDNNPVVVSWPSDLSAYGTKWTIKPIAGADWPQTDMIKDRSVSIAPFTQKNIIIIKEGAKLTDVERLDSKAADFALSQNYPNPFNPSTSIVYSLEKTSLVKLEVFSFLGKAIMTLDAGFREAGTYQVHFDASALASGMYFYRLTAGSFEKTRTMILTR